MRWIWRAFIFEYISTDFGKSIYLHSNVDGDIKFIHEHTKLRRRQQNERNLP